MLHQEYSIDSGRCSNWFLNGIGETKCMLGCVQAERIDQARGSTAERLFPLPRGLSETASCSDENFSNKGRDQHPGCAVQGRKKIGVAVRWNGLQRLQQCRERYEGCPNDERPGPSEAEHQRDDEIAREVVELPAKSRTWLPFCGAQADK